MRLWLRRFALAWALSAGTAFAQPGTKPEPLPPQGSAATPSGQRPQRCAPQIAEGCSRMQSSCEVACPGLWSSNPSAPALTPTDRTLCRQRCLTQYQGCMARYGCW